MADRVYLDEATDAQLWSELFRRKIARLTEEQRRNVLRAILAGVEDEPEGQDEDPLPPPTVDETLDLLLLTGLFDRVLRSDVEGWNDEQREMAVDWAAAVHVRANDHDDVVIPIMPACVSDLLTRMSHA